MYSTLSVSFIEHSVRFRGDQISRYNKTQKISGKFAQKVFYLDLTLCMQKTNFYLTRLGTSAKSSVMLLIVISQK